VRKKANSLSVLLTNLLISDLSLMETEKSDNVFGNPFGDVSYMSSKTPSLSFGGETSPLKTDGYSPTIVAAGVETLEKMKEKSIPTEGDAKRVAFFGSVDGKPATYEQVLETSTLTPTDQIYSLRAEFSGFIVSIVDSAPSEVAVMCVKNFNALARWDANRSTDATVMMSVGLFQLDNHVPNAPFPVAIRPDDSRREALDDDDSSVGSDKLDEGILPVPLLMIGLAFAPKHQSGIVVS
jgi:hypothetical protein